MSGLLLLMLSAGCAPAERPASEAAAEPAPYVCLLPGEKRMLVAELFFGRNVHGRAPVSDAEWADFAARVITRYLPDGFTVHDGAGQWLNPQTGNIIRERTKILTVASDKPRPDLKDRLSAIIEAYRGHFRQQSVDVITRNACASF
jgi:Protein of unknown function (DUF3574)